MAAFQNDITANITQSVTRSCTQLVGQCYQSLTQELKAAHSRIDAQQHDIDLLRATVLEQQKALERLEKVVAADAAQVATNSTGYQRKPRKDIVRLNTAEKVTLDAVREAMAAEFDQHL
eukprot:5149072-Karenia_brevis.AAC.1